MTKPESTPNQRYHSSKVKLNSQDKCNSVVIVEQEAYVKRMKNLLNDQRKFERASLKNDVFRNFSVNQSRKTYWHHF